MRSCVWNGLDAPALPRSSHDFSSGRNREIHQAAARDPFARPHEYIISPLSQSLGAGKQQVNWRLMGRDLLTPVVMEKRKRKKKKPIWPRRLRVRRQSWWAELGDVDKKGRDERTSPSFRARESDSQRPAAFFSCILFILLSKQQKRRCGIISKVFPCFLWKKVLWCRYKTKQVKWWKLNIRRRPLWIRCGRSARRDHRRRPRSKWRSRCTCRNWRNLCRTCPRTGKSPNWKWSSTSSTTFATCKRPSNRTTRRAIGVAGASPMPPPPSWLPAAAADNLSVCSPPFPTPPQR